MHFRLTVEMWVCYHWEIAECILQNRKNEANPKHKGCDADKIGGLIDRYLTLYNPKC